MSVNNNTVMVIGKDALAGFEAALTAAGLPSAQWIGTKDTLRTSAAGDYVLIHDWTQCANDALKAKVATLLDVASKTAGVKLITQADLSAAEKASEHGILENWKDKCGLTWVDKKE